MRGDQWHGVATIGSGDRRCASPRPESAKIADFIARTTRRASCAANITVLSDFNGSDGMDITFFDGHQRRNDAVLSARRGDPGAIA